MRAFRPWGLLDWMLPRLSPNAWRFVGCMSTESRCLAAWDRLRVHKPIVSEGWLRVDDPPSRFDELRSSLLEKRLAEYKAAGGSCKTSSLPLHSNHDVIVAVCRELIGGVRNVVIDISSFPKRLFFPLMRLAYSAPHIDNLLVSYTIPERYSNEDLAEDPAGWAGLPTFLGGTDAAPDLFVIGVGFQLGGLSQLLQNFQPRDARFLLSVQSHPNSFKRSWAVIEGLQQHLRVKVEPMRVHPWDTSAAFDYLATVSEHGRRNVVLVPYGPKPISLAMCLFGIDTNAPAFYAQPRVYNPLYSVGVSHYRGVPLCYSYALKLDSRGLYRVETTSP